MTEKLDEDERTRAMTLLSTLRRRLAARAAHAVLERESELLKQAESTHSPLDFGREFDIVAVGLNRVDRLIAAIQERQDNRGAPPNEAERSRTSVEEAAKRAFDRFASLVSEVKLEDAAREISRVFQMPLDRAATATRFFARAVRARPELTQSLSNLHTVLAGESSLAMRQLMMVFGFQAVESQMAIEALRGRQPRPAST